MIPGYSKKMLECVLIISGIVISSDLLSQNLDSVKCWSDKDKLKWSDFRGEKSENEDDFLKAASAIGVTPISFEKNNILCYKIEVVFRRYHSWTLDTAKHLLAHEQLHFDIAELTARRLRKAIQEVKTSKQNPTAQDFHIVIQKSYNESADTHDEYDQQTYHGVITDSQVEWQKKIDIGLKQMKDYASTAADCK